MPNPPPSPGEDALPFGVISTAKKAEHAPEQSQMQSAARLFEQKNRTQQLG